MRTIYAIRLLFFIGLFSLMIFIPREVEKRLHSASELIEKFEAGPVKSQKKRVVGVKTNFTWTESLTPCRCPEDQGPCIETFLNKSSPAQPTQRYPRMIEDYFIQNSQGNEYQGAGQVPWGIEKSSVRLINIPFCGQIRRGKENPTTK